MFANQNANPRRFGKSYSSQGHRSGGTNNSYFSKQLSRRGGFTRPKRNFGETLDISSFIQRSSIIAPKADPEIKNTFTDFCFSPSLQFNLKKRNYVKPTPIQDQAILPISNGRDIIGLANTGTGKTGAFLLPMIDKVSKNRSQKVLIIAPTRELAIQIGNELEQFSETMRLFSAVCVGGSPIYKQINSLRRNPNFIIGTPGRLKDLGKRGLIRFETISNVIIDEIDRMLDMGFVDEIKNILGQLPKERQTLFFSATLPPKIKELVFQFLIDPITIDVKTSQTVSNIDQNIVNFKDRASKFYQLQQLLKQADLKKVLIFGETKIEVEKLASDLSEDGFLVNSIHGDKRQSQREKALSLFKNNGVNILVATDVAARGLDIQDITHVINYTMPHTYEDYVHRIGRTGRGNNKGTALTFVEAKRSY